MGPSAPRLHDGVYARKQFLSRARLIAWTHSRRFQVGLSLASGLRGARVLDYGCGDGSFLAMLLDGGEPPAEALGVDIDPGLVADCRRRLGAAGAGFATPDELSARPAESFDAIFCMEVLEHVVGRAAVLDRLTRLLAPGGRLVISVPVETGLPLLVKQFARRVAGWRGIGDYPGTTPYRAGEWWPSISAGARQHIERPVHRAADGSPFHCHKGFNWMLLREEVSARLPVKRVVASPFTFLPPHLGTQAWIVATKPAPSR